MKKNLNESIMGFFISLNFHNEDNLVGYKKDSSPWLTSVSRDQSCVVSHIYNKAIDPTSIQLNLSINGEEQTKMLYESVHKIPRILEHLTKYMTINKGDVLMTGSPFFNTLPLKAGDHISGRLFYDQRAMIKTETYIIKRE